MIYPVENGYVISSHHVWLPGVYDTEKAARYAFRFPNETLEALSNRICHINGENRNITKDDLRKTQAELSNEEKGDANL